MQKQRLIRNILESAGGEFDPEQDPEQIPHTREAVEKFFNLHPSAIVYREDTDGTFIGWSAAVPTTKELADRFVSEQISERELFDRTTSEVEPEAVYFSGVVVVPEYRRQGYGSLMLKEQIQAFYEENPDALLCVWTVSEEGRKLVDKVKRDLAVDIRDRSH